jgi:uncharacterized protein (TIGR02118 family)
VIKVSVLYPNSAGARFDHTYYRDKHMPMVKSRLGARLKSYSIDKGLAGGAPNEPPAFLAIGSLFCESVDDFQAGFGPHAAEILGDIPNYTDVNPTIVISEVVVG